MISFPRAHAPRYCTLYKPNFIFNEIKKYSQLTIIIFSIAYMIS